MKRYPVIRTLSALLVLVVITGCTLHGRGLTPDEIRQRSELDLTGMATAPPITKPLSLSQAMARGIEYNLDLEVERYRQLVSATGLEEVKWQLAPSALAEGNTVLRSSPPDQRNSSNFEGRRRDVASANLRWSVLDFAIGYIRTQQALNDVFITREQTRATLNRLISEVRIAWWRAVLAEQRLQAGKKLAVDIHAMSQQFAGDHYKALMDPLTILGYQRELLTLSGRLASIERERQTAFIELAALINSHTAEFPLPASTSGDQTIPELPALTELERLALRQSPELQESDYRIRNRAWDLSGAKWRWLPNIDVFASARYDDSANLEDSHWEEQGVGISLDLMGVFKVPARIRAAEAELDAEEARRLALAMMVVKQVRMTASEQQSLMRDYQRTRDYRALVAKEWEVRHSRERFDPEDEIALLRTRCDLLLAEYDVDQAWLGLLKGYESILLAAGIDQVPLPLLEQKGEGLALSLVRHRTIPSLLSYLDP
ncbi:TolC family protein [Kistimonas asteriae]|uniref:TolC family protein n=1 Tax=Kistimonas asteriae TaxID=517724 RepID=UPI001BA87797|nr:TolC family protein [Kistimonas asteriae]